MERRLALHERQALVGLTREFDVIKRQFRHDDLRSGRAPRATTPAGWAAEVAPEDWSGVLSAVKDRLGWIVDGPLAAPAGTPIGNTEQARAGVLDCVAALDRLQLALVRRFGQRPRHEPAPLARPAALVHMRTSGAQNRARERTALPLALRDGIGSLSDRSAVRERLEQALAPEATQRPMLALLYVDLDGFQPIKATLGHDAGDELLRIVGERLARAVRAEDVVSHLGGDEFACLLAQWLDREQLSQLACKVFDAVAEPLTIGEVKLSVRPSIGIAICPGDSTTAEALLEHASVAMVRAKRHQTGYAFFDRHGSV
jgi:diguanylate cyclase